jgi:magnesium transporter
MKTTTRPRGAKPPRSADSRGGSTAKRSAEPIQVRRFDADRTDTILTFEAALAEHPKARQLLWIDVLGALPPGASAALAERFGLDERTRVALEEPGDRPILTIHGTYFHVRVAAEPSGAARDDGTWFDVVAGADNVVISRHTGPVAFLADLDERIDADAALGALDPATFVALLLDGAVTSYFAAADAIEEEIDDLDARSLLPDDRTDLLDDLVALRRRVAHLRRALTAHRSVFASLAQTGLANLVDDDAGAGALIAVGKRFDDAVAAVEDSREALIGSFDVFMTRTAQRTNDIMKILAMTSVLLLPGSLIAGLLGMNVSIPLDKDSPLSFWLVIGGVLALAVLIVAFARVRRWL